MAEHIFSCDKGAFLRALQSVATLVSADAGYQHERYALVVANDTNITIRGMRYGRGEVMVRLAATVTTPTTFGLPKEGALARLAALPGPDLTFYRVSDAEVGVQSGGIKTTFLQEAVHDYPPAPYEHQEVIARLVSPDIGRAFRLARITTDPAMDVSTHAIRIMITPEGAVILGASAQWGITRATLALATDVSEPVELLLPTSTAEPIFVLFHDKKLVIMGDENCVSLQWGDTIATCVRWGGVYPVRALEMIETYVPHSSMVVPIRELESAIKILKGMRADKKGATVAMLSFAHGLLRVRAPRQGYDGRLEADLSAELVGVPCGVGINADQLAEVLAEAHTETITIGVCDKGIVRVEGDIFVHLATSIGGTYSLEGTDE